MKKIILFYILFYFGSCTKYETNIYKNEDISLGKIINVIQDGYDVTPNDPSDDDAPGIQRAIDAAAGSIVYLEEGTYHLDTPIVYFGVEDQMNTGNPTQPWANAPGLKIIGDGTNKTILVNRTNDYAIKVLGVKNNLEGHFIFYKKQQNGYFKDFTIRGATHSEGAENYLPKGGFMLISTNQFLFENIKILGRTSTPFLEHGIFIPKLNTSYWSVLGFNSESDFQLYANNVNPNVFNFGDYYASNQNDFKNVNISHANGYGFFGENGVGFSFSARNCNFWYLKKAAIYTSGHLCSFIGGTVVRCGTRFDTTTGGIIVDKGIYYAPNGLIIKDIEFDNNQNFHIWVKSLVNGEISNNRFVCNEIQTSNQLRTPVGCIIAGFNNEQVRNLKMEGNYFRTQHLNNYPFTSFILNNNTYSSTFTQNYMLESQNTSQLTTYSLSNGAQSNNNLVIHEGEILLNGNLTPSFTVDLRSSTQSYLPLVNSHIDWTYVRFDNYNRFNIDISNNDYYTLPLGGNWSFNSKVSFTGASIGDRVTLRITYINEGSTAEHIALTETKICDSNTVNTVNVVGIIPLSSGTEIYTKIVNGSSNNTINLLTSTSSSFFSGFLID